MRVEDPTDLDWYLDHVVVPGDLDRAPIGPVRTRQGAWTALAHRLRVAAADNLAGAALRLALVQGFVLSRAQALALGVGTTEVRRLSSNG